MKEKLSELHRISQLVWGEPRYLSEGSYECTVTLFIPATLPPTYVIGSGPGREIIHVLSAHAVQEFPIRETVNLERQITVLACAPRLRDPKPHLTVKTVSLSDLFMTVKLPSLTYLQDRKFLASISITPSKDKENDVNMTSYDVHLIERIVKRNTPKETGKSKVLSTMTVDLRRNRRASFGTAEAIDLQISIPPNTRCDMDIPNVAFVSHALRIIARYTMTSPIPTTGPNPVFLESHAEIAVNVLSQPSSQWTLGDKELGSAKANKDMIGYWKTLYLDAVSELTGKPGASVEEEENTEGDDGADAKSETTMHSVATSDVSYKTTGSVFSTRLSRTKARPVSVHSGRADSPAPVSAPTSAAAASSPLPYVDPSAGQKPSYRHSVADLQEMTRSKTEGRDSVGGRPRTPSILKPVSTPTVSVTPSGQIPKPVDMGARSWSSPANGTAGPPDLLGRGSRTGRSPQRNVGPQQQQRQQPPYQQWEASSQQQHQQMAWEQYSYYYHYYYGYQHFAAAVAANTSQPQQQVDMAKAYHDWYYSQFQPYGMPMPSVAASPPSSAPVAAAAVPYAQPTSPTPSIRSESPLPTPKPLTTATTQIRSGSPMPAPRSNPTSPTSPLETPDRLLTPSPTGSARALSPTSSLKARAMSPTGSVGSRTRIRLSLSIPAPQNVFAAAVSREKTPSPSNRRRSGSSYVPSPVLDVIEEEVGAGGESEEQEEEDLKAEEEIMIKGPEMEDLVLKEEDTEEEEVEVKSEIVEVTERTEDGVVGGGSEIVDLGERTEDDDVEENVSESVDFVETIEKVEVLETVRSVEDVVPSESAVISPEDAIVGSASPKSISSMDSAATLRQVDPLTDLLPEPLLSLEQTEPIFSTEPAPLSISTEQPVATEVKAVEVDSEPKKPSPRRQTSAIWASDTLVHSRPDNQSPLPVIDMEQPKRVPTPILKQVPLNPTPPPRLPTASMKSSIAIDVAEARKAAVRSGRPIQIRATRSSLDLVRPLSPSAVAIAINPPPPPHELASPAVPSPSPLNVVTSYNEEEPVAPPRSSSKSRFSMSHFGGLFGAPVKRNTVAWTPRK
ncbi:hypothetical protein HDU97_000727 [Phlyctochytrium planicorne]|nr:hypothetical protein HDU97_000727 [Phlyctochytrium planicorne]